MYMRVVYGKVQPDQWEKFERHYQQAMDETPDVKGLKGRYLARDLDNPDSGFSVTFWEDEASMRDYWKSNKMQEILERAETYYTGDYYEHACEVRLSEES